MTPKSVFCLWVGIVLAAVVPSGCVDHTNDFRSAANERDPITEGDRVPVTAGFEKRTEQLTADRAQQKWVTFAFSTPNHMDDLILLQKRLQAAQIGCWGPVSELGTGSLFVDPNNFTRARSAAAKIIHDNSLTVNVEVDPKSNGYEIWENGVKTGEKYF